MERYIKPNCEATKVIIPNCILLNTSPSMANTVGYGDWNAPKREDITPSLSQPDLLKEDRDDSNFLINTYED